MFNLETFDIKLDTDFIGRNFIYSEELDSTNSFLMDKQNKINTNGTVIFAEKQLHGKGRKDRTWSSGKGQNLTFSILITDKKILKGNLNYINFAAALSVGQAVENRFQLKTEMKWPNDVLIHNKKIAGILLETSSQGNKIERLVAGIGLNVNQSVFQGNFKIPPTSLSMETGENVEREMILAELLNIFEENLYRLENHSNSLLNEWRNRCMMIGERITIEDNGKIRSGIFDDIDNNGYLLLRHEGKVETIHFGDVSLI